MLSNYENKAVAHTAPDSTLPVRPEGFAAVAEYVRESGRRLRAVSARLDAVQSQLDRERDAHVRDMMRREIHGLAAEKERLEQVFVDVGVQPAGTVSLASCFITSR